MRNAIRANVAGAFHVAVARRLAIFWVNRANYGDAVSLIEELLTQVTPDSIDAIELHADLATARGAAGDTVGAMNHAAIAFEGIASIPVDRRPQVLARIAHAHFFARNHVQAEDIANEAVALATQLGPISSEVAFTTTLFDCNETHQDTTCGVLRSRNGVAAENAGDQMRVASLSVSEAATIRGDDEVNAQTERPRRCGPNAPYRDTRGGRANRAMHEGGRRNFRQA